MRCLFECFCFFTHPMGFDLKENQDDTVLWLSSCPFPDANMNCVHCINAYNEDLVDDDVELLKHVLQTLIVQNNIQCHVTCCCSVCFSWKKLFIKSNLWVILLCCSFPTLSERNASGSRVPCRCVSLKWHGNTHVTSSPTSEIDGGGDGKFCHVINEENTSRFLTMDKRRQTEFSSNLVLENLSRCSASTLHISQWKQRVKPANHYCTLNKPKSSN